jgi:hypothetical protein
MTDLREGAALQNSQRAYGAYGGLWMRKLTSNQYARKTEILQPTDIHGRFFDFCAKESDHGVKGAAHRNTLHSCLPRINALAFRH